jgi:tRNA threonylcarbamoyladenosine biosynthesis protein TsaE
MTGFPAMVGDRSFGTIALDLPDSAATEALGYWLGQRLPVGTVLLLYGDLGHGKTTLVKGLGRGLGITEAIDSPTFTLINEYLAGRVPLYHVDLYRVEGPAITGLFLDAYWEGLEFPPGIMAIEWADRLPTLPPDPLSLTLSPTATGRHALITPSTPAQATLLESLTPDALLVDEV